MPKAAFIVLCILSFVQGVVSLCTEYTTCGECITGGPDCAWCTKVDFGQSRCDTKDHLLKSNCGRDTNIISPSSTVEYYKNYPPQDGDTPDQAVQLSPQEVKFDLRINSNYKLDVKYSIADHYPVDLYFLMDLTRTMDVHRLKLSQVGATIATNMGKITSDFRIGFGAFVEKEVMPFSNDKADAWGGSEPYTFQNVLPLTTDLNTFKDKVSNAPTSPNIDRPEAGLDALMQAIVCKEEIGWRNSSKKIIVYSSDGDVHIAGDGRLGGIVKPNDEKCHLDNTGFYDQGKFQDYPSISQVERQLIDNQVSVIFAIPENSIEFYAMLSSYFPGSVVSPLAENSNNIVALIEDNYKLINSKVELVPTNVPENVRISIESKCTGATTRKVSFCDQVTIDDVITFTINILAYEKAPTISTAEINVVGASDKLVMHINTFSSCDCEGNTQPSPKCPNNGILKCGKCYGGDSTVSCDRNKTTEEIENTCRRLPSDKTVCSGRGDCEGCGECNCHPVSRLDISKTYSGQFCECSDYSCPYVEGQLCGGRAKGSCKCGVCKCTEDYTGQDCECPISKSACRANNGLLCNGKGRCECGRCICDSTSNYRGPTCEDCPTCPGRCESNKACVQCRLSDSEGPLSKAQCSLNCSYVDIVEDISETIKGEEDKWKECSYKSAADGCVYTYSYLIDSEPVAVMAQSVAECPTSGSSHILAPQWIVVITTVVVGLVVIIVWKIIVFVQEKRELKRLKDENGPDLRYLTGSLPPGNNGGAIQNACCADDAYKDDICRAGSCKGLHVELPDDIDWKKIDDDSPFLYEGAAKGFVNPGINSSNMDVSPKDFDNRESATSDKSSNQYRDSVNPYFPNSPFEKCAWE